MTAETRNPGRPRDETVDERIIKSALEILNERGMAGLSIEAVTAQAGVSKASFYRRWESRSELLVDVVASVADTLSIPDSGDLLTDLVAAVRGLCAFAGDSRAGEVLPWLVGEIAAKTPAGLRYQSTVMMPRREMLVGLLAAAAERGDIDPALDADSAVEMLVGPVVLRKLMGTLADASDTWPEVLVDTLISGWSTKARRSQPAGH